MYVVSPNDLLNKRKDITMIENSNYADSHLSLNGRKVILIFLKLNFKGFFFIVFGISWLIKTGIPYEDMTYFVINDTVGFERVKIKIHHKIRIALQILLLPCMAFYLIQIPFKLKYLWLYFSLVFLVFFLLYYSLPRILGEFSQVKPISVGDFVYRRSFGLRHFIKPDYVFCFSLCFSGICFLFDFPYSHLLLFSFGLFIFCFLFVLIYRYIKNHLIPQADYGRPITLCWDFFSIKFHQNVLSFEEKAQIYHIGQ